MDQLRTHISGLLNEGTRAQSAIALADMRLTRDQAATLRLTPGAVQSLLTLLQPHEQDISAQPEQPSQDLVEGAGPMDALLEGSVAHKKDVAMQKLQVAALSVALGAATIDVLFKEALIVAEVVRKV